MMDPFAREIFDRARRAHDPTPDDRARVRAKLAARIGAGAVAGAGAAKVAGVTKGTILKVVLSIAIVAALGAAFVLRRHAPAPEAPAIEAPVVQAPAPVAPVTSAASPAASAAESSAEPVAPTVESAAPSPSAAPPPVARSARPAASTDLEAEMSLLAGAQAAIQAGDYATAIARLDEHQRQFPRGVLSEERLAARVVALCGAGRVAEARSLGASFLAHHPSSPLAPRVRSSCAAP